MDKGAPSVPLVDSFGRVHRSLRISVTDRCNIRCFYCMPEGPLQFQPKTQLLTFEEISRFVRVCVGLGIHKYRLTGGEPLIRQDVTALVNMLVRIEGVDEVAMTTNGLLLSDYAVELRRAGLHRLNISLDTLDATRFEQIARRPGLSQVLAGIAAAKGAGFARLRLNSIAVRGVTELEIINLVQFAIDEQIELRFIEYMPLDADTKWSSERVLNGSDIRSIVESEFGKLRPMPRDVPSQPAVDYELCSRESGRPLASLGFICSVSAPFCGTCDRLRITADGQVRNCLFSTSEWDARALLRSGATDNEIAQLVRESVAAKKPGHGIDEPGFLRPERAMYQIGG